MLERVLRKLEEDLYLYQESVGLRVIIASRWEGESKIA